MPMQRVIISLPAELLERLDTTRGLVSRAAFIRNMLHGVCGDPGQGSDLNRPVTAARMARSLAREVEPRFKK